MNQKEFTFPRDLVSSKSPHAVNIFTFTEGFGIVNVTWERPDISAFLIEKHV